MAARFAQAFLLRGRLVRRATRIAGLAAGIAASPGIASPASVRVLVDGVEQVAIRRVLLPEITSEVMEFTIVGENQTLIRFVPGRTQVGPTTLVREPLKGGDWEAWMRTVTDGTARRGSLDVVVRDAAGADLQAWTIRDAFPSQWRIQAAAAPAVGLEEVLVVHGTLAALDEVPQILAIAPVSGGVLEVTFRSEAGRRYRLQATGALPPTGVVWSNVGPEIVATGDASVIAAPAPVPGSPVFLRVVLLPPAP